MSSKAINEYGKKLISIMHTVMSILSGSNLQFHTKDFVAYAKATEGHPRKDTLRALLYLQETGKIKITDSGYVLLLRS